MEIIERVVAVPGSQRIQLRAFRKASFVKSSSAVARKVFVLTAFIIAVLGVGFGYPGIWTKLSATKL